MNARFRKGKNYKILSGKFKDISLNYHGFDRTTETYIFTDGIGVNAASIGWNIPANSKLVLSQLESEKGGSNGYS